MIGAGIEIDDLTRELRMFGGDRPREAQRRGLHRVHCTARRLRATSDDQHACRPALVRIDRRLHQVQQAAGAEIEQLIRKLAALRIEIKIPEMHDAGGGAAYPRGDSREKPATIPGIVRIDSKRVGVLAIRQNPRGPLCTSRRHDRVRRLIALRSPSGRQTPADGPSDRRSPPVRRLDATRPRRASRRCGAGRDRINASRVARFAVKPSTARTSSP